MYGGGTTTKAEYVANKSCTKQMLQTRDENVIS